MSKETAPKFVIEEDDDEPGDKPTLESDRLVVSPADRAIGTLGFCSALLAVCAC